MAWFEHGDSRIYYEEEGSGDTVLVVPGVTLSIDDMQVARQTLVPRYRVIAADAPGSGQSAPQPRAYAPTYYEDDTRAFLALLHQLDATPAHVVGCSDGGEYALLMAAIDPAAVRSVVTWGAAGKLDVPLEFVQAFGEVVDNPLPALAGLSEYLKAAYGEENARKTARSLSQAWGAIIAAGGSISRDRAAEIACPALLITGEHDSVFAPVALVSGMARAMPNAEFVEAKGAGHLVHHDAPDWLATTMLEWLSKH